MKDNYGITIQNLRDKLDTKLADDTATQLAKRPSCCETGFTLLLANYAINILVRDAKTGRIGTFQTSFVIPDSNKEEQRIPTEL